jgi:hypothetical protein
MVHPALVWCPEPHLFGGRDGELWEWSDLSCHSLVGSFSFLGVMGTGITHEGVMTWRVVKSYDKRRACNGQTDKHTDNGQMGGPP